MILTDLFAIYMKFKKILADCLLHTVQNCIFSTVDGQVDDIALWELSYI